MCLGWWTGVPPPRRREDPAGFELSKRSSAPLLEGRALDADELSVPDRRARADAPLPAEVVAMRPLVGVEERAAETERHEQWSDVIGLWGRRRLANDDQFGPDR